MCKSNLVFVASFLFCLSAAAQSEQDIALQTEEIVFFPNDTVKNKKGEILQEVTITSNQQKKPVTVGKSGIQAMDLPQSTAVINQAVLQNQQVLSVTDLLKNVNGVYIMGNTGGYQEEIASRGTSLSSSNTFKNGVRYFNGMRTEFSGIEKAEFLKGSAAILYGNVAPGGVLNLVTKKPRYEFGGEVGFRYGSFDAIQPTFDLYGALNKSKTAAFRIDGTYAQANSFRKEVQSESYYFNPSFLVKLGKKTELLIEGDFLKDRKTPDFGSGIVNYEIVELPRDRFLGASWGTFDAQQLSATATLTHQLSDNWNLSFINSYRYYETELFSTTRPNASGAFVGTDGTWKRGVQRSQAQDNYVINQVDLTGTVQTGKISHQILVGADNELYKTKTTAYKNLANYDTINIFEAYNAAAEPAIPNLDLNTLTSAPISRFGVYVQDLVSFSKYIKLLAGVRYSYQDTESTVYNYGTTATATTNSYDEAFSPRLGLVLQPSENHSVFASYSNSFQVNTGTDLDGNALKPSIIDQYEVGLKNKFFNDHLFANVTVYQISNNNLAQTTLALGNSDPNKKELAGATRSQGVEIDLVANPFKGLSLLAGYSFNETKYVKSNIYVEGSELRYNPKNTANFSVNYKFEGGALNGVNLGVISSYFGKRFAGRSTRLTTPNDTFRLIALEDFYQLDATLGYQWNHWALRSKLSNIFNELNYNIHDDNSLNPIAPRNYSLSLTYSF